MRGIFTIHTDRGHGWLSVTVQDLLDVKLTPNDFSRYSYRHNGWFYLEEDCDAPKFLNAYERIAGRLPVIINEHFEGNSSIRNYARILPVVTKTMEAGLAWKTPRL